MHTLTRKDGNQVLCVYIYVTTICVHMLYVDLVGVINLQVFVYY